MKKQKEKETPKEPKAEVKEDPELKKIKVIKHTDSPTWQRADELRAKDTLSESEKDELAKLDEMYYPPDEPEEVT